MRYLCECRNGWCREQLELTREEYQLALLSSGYVVRKGHEDATDQVLAFKGETLLVKGERDANSRNV